MINLKHITELSLSATNAGFKFNPDDLQLIIWNAGLKTHIPTKLPTDFAAIYIFEYKNEYLKVGKVNKKSSARYQSQHYNPKSSNSNLAKTIQKSTVFSQLIGDMHPGKWLKENTTRYNILIPCDFGKNFVHFAEAFYILKCNPKFEKTRS